MTRTGQAAIDYARGRVGHGPPPPAGMDEPGMCLAFTREPFAVAPLYASAIDAWNACRVPHPDDRNPPAAVPVWFRTPSVYDHVCMFVGPHEVISTYNDDVFVFDGIGDIEASFDGTYLGWGEDINGVTVYSPGPPAPPIRRDRTMQLVRIVEDGRIFFFSDIFWEQIPDLDHANALASVLGPWVDVSIVTGQRINDQVNHNITVMVDNIAGQIEATP